MVWNLKKRVRLLKQDIHALYLAGRDARVPWYAKLVVAVVAAYAVSPIDLIPDFIPVIGYLDDLVLLPLGIWLAIRLIPADILADCRERAGLASEKPTSRRAACVIVLVWVSIAVAGALWLSRISADAWRG